MPGQGSHKQTNIEYSQTSLITSDPNCHSGTTVSVPFPTNQAFSLSSQEPSASTFELLFFLENCLFLK